MRVDDEDPPVAKMNRAACLARNPGCQRSFPLATRGIGRHDRVNVVIALQLGLRRPGRQEDAPVGQTLAVGMRIRPVVLRAVGHVDPVRPRPATITREDPVRLQVEGADVVVRVPGFDGVEPAAVLEFDDRAAGRHLELIREKTFEVTRHRLGPVLSVVRRPQEEMLEGEDTAGFWIEHELSARLVGSSSPQHERSVAQDRNEAVTVVDLARGLVVLNDRALPLPGPAAVSRAEQLEHSVRRIEGAGNTKRGQDLAAWQAHRVRIEGVDHPVAREWIPEDHAAVFAGQSCHRSSLSAFLNDRKCDDGRDFTGKQQEKQAPRSHGRRVRVPCVEDVLTTSG